MKLPARSCRPRCPAQGARTPLARQCRRPSHRRPCAAQASTTDEEDLAGWQEFFDSDDLALPDDAIPAELRGLVRQPKGNATPPSTPVVTGHCYGCGLNLQTDHPDGLGYVEAGLYRQKRAHRQQNEVLCSRRAAHPTSVSPRCTAPAHSALQHELPCTPSAHKHNVTV